MTLTDDRTGIPAVIAKVADDDEGTALTLLQFGFYEALCDEADRIRPIAERRAAQEIIKRTEGALERLAKRYAESDEAGKAAASAVADDVVKMRRAAEVVLSKDYLDDHNVAQGEGGKFRRKGVRGAVLDLLGIGTKQNLGADSKPERTASTLDSIVGDSANTYTRLRTLGQGLVASSNSNARGAGTAARIVGDVGQEAQRALEPGIRRTAYRYRGTERRPNPAAQRQARALAGSVTEGAGTSQDQARLRVLGDFGASLLWRQIPDAETARISLEAGKMPPSVGVMFDADGNLVSEAMGYNGDHYLPFDLKNLKRLKGGSYVRTRTTGGPTDEDIYTALLSGARQIQVVSNSGNFVIEFDPSLRGGRRYSDKARQMVDRYSRLVSAIGSGKIMQTDLKPEVMRDIRANAFEQAGGDGPLTRTLIDQEVQRRRMEARFSEVDEDQLLEDAQSEALAEYKGKPAVSQRQILQRTDELFKAKVREQRENVARAYRLDGAGYGAAMKALKTEFPYFIRNIEYTPLHQYLGRINATDPGEKLPPRGGPDMGYTRRGELAPYHRPTPSGSETRPKAERTGRKARPESTAPAGDLAPAPTAPTGNGETKAPVRPTVSGQIRLPEPDAPSLEQLAQKHQVELKVGLQSAMGGVVQVIKDVPDVTDTPPELDDDISVITGPNVSPAMYGGWLYDHFGGDSRKMADFLAKPENGAYRTKTKEFIEHLAALQPRFTGVNVKPEVFSQATSALDLVDGGATLFEEGEPEVTTPVNTSNPKPFAWPEIMALGASQKNLEAYARAHPKVAEIAAQLQAAPNADEAAVKLIEEPAHQARLGIRSAQENEKLAGFKGSLADARQYHHQGERHPTITALKDAHLAWALVKVEEAVHTLRESEPLRFADVGPKAKAPVAGEPEEQAKRFVPQPAVRVVKVDRDSPIAKAYRSRLLGSGPASR